MCVKFEPVLESNPDARCETLLHRTAQRMRILGLE